MAQDLARAKGIETPAIAGWKLEIGDDVARYTARESAARGAVARFYEQEAGQEAPVAAPGLPGPGFDAPYRAGIERASARLTTGTRPRPRSRLYAALRDGRAPAAPPARRTPNGAPRDARAHAKPGTVSAAPVAIWPFRRETTRFIANRGLTIRSRTLHPLHRRRLGLARHSRNCKRKSVFHCLPQQPGI